MRQEQSCHAATLLNPDTPLIHPLPTAKHGGSLCHTQEEIAEKVDVHQDTVSDWTKSFTEKLESNNSVNSTNFEPPIYNVWKQQARLPHTGRDCGEGGGDAKNTFRMGRWICEIIRVG